ncbi:hypothetical protein CATYP_03105 [Corynebacterium atypicum]|uniref:Uncharacterized protein n=1 Tax=Corynebacterium atypicum TaxID=191610 RepID=A0ABN4DBR9_9CORY|nr:hypothetical protein [Corynebacterium atypicum]AIG63835.1 hypothetical protein CATYP_03105 [Corynebacterium atypicum]
MANDHKQQHVNPAWPEVQRERAHAVTEIVAPLSGASSPFGDDLVLPRPHEELSYVHPYTRINR